MPFDLLIKGLVSLLPVMIFVITLDRMDSYKLVRPQFILWLLVAGGTMAALSYFINAEAIELLHFNFQNYSRFGAPVIEECLKASILVVLFRASRIGFLIDAAIIGFAVGSGFAVFENFYYLTTDPEAHMGVWIIRGFGTALMHGGCTAIFAVMAQALTEHHTKTNPALFFPGLVLAMVLHSIFNHFPGSPILATMGTMLSLPIILALVFRIGGREVHNWLEVDFSVHQHMLEQIEHGEFTASPSGRFLSELHDKFHDLIIADMVRYVRLHTELVLRAEGLLIAREHGMEIPIDTDIHQKFAEMHKLQKKIGRTAFSTIKAHLHITREDLWELHMLEERDLHAR